MVRLVRSLLVTVVVLALIVFGGGGWYYASQAMDPGTPGPDPRHAEVVAIDGDTVTIRPVDAPSWAVADLTGDGVVGFDHERGYLQLRGAPQSADGGATTRTMRVLDGNPPAVGDRGSLEVSSFPDDPNWLGLGLQDVQMTSDLGSFPGWVFRGGEQADRWIVFVHGLGGTRHGALRAVQHVVGELGMSALVITYRNDPGAPPSPDGHGHFGDSEWEDLQAWLDWLRANQDVGDVVLYGFSQGGSVVASCLRRCEAGGDVSRAVLDSPLLSISETLELQARNRDIPGPLIDPLLASAGFIIEFRGGADLSRLEHVEPLAELDLPILVFHGTADTTVPISTSRALAERDPGQVTFVEHDGEHVRAWNVDQARYDDALTTFLAPAT